MVTLFDIITVASFAALVAGFFLWTDRDKRTLLHFSVSGLALAIANQLGNAGSPVFATVLVVAALAYAVLMAWPRTS